MYYDPANYPPTINACRVQAEAGHDVHLLGFFRGNHAGFVAGSGIIEHYLNTAPGSFPDSVAQKVFQLHRFRSGVRDLLRRVQPDIVIGYDFHGLWGVAPAIEVARVIYHCHDMPTPGQEGALGRLDRHLFRTSLKTLERLSAIVMPEPTRLEVARKEWRYNGPSYVVPNCSCVPAARSTMALRESIRADSGSWPEIVIVRAGGAGEAHLLRESVEAMSLLPAGYHLCLIGCAARQTIDQILRNMPEGVRRRVHSYPYMNYDEMKTLLPAADIGLALYRRDSIDINKLHSAFASDKYMEYLAAGLAIVALKRQDFETLAQQTGGVGLAEHQTPEAIAGAILELTRSPERLERFKREARRAYEDRFNYQEQYRQVLAHIVSPSRDATNSEGTPGLVAGTF